MDEKERLVRIKNYLDAGVLDIDAIDPDDLEAIRDMYKEEVNNLYDEALKKAEMLMHDLQEN